MVGYKNNHNLFMQKANTNATPSDSMVITIARFGQTPQNVTVPEGASVNVVLSTAGIELEGREELFVEGVNAEAHDVLENGDILSIVTPKQAG